jgi:hypothetical protein
VGVLMRVDRFAPRKRVDALREDRLHNNLVIADGTSGDVRTSAVPLDHKACVTPGKKFKNCKITIQTRLTRRDSKWSSR